MLHLKHPRPSLILAIEYNWHYTKEGEAYERYETNRGYTDGFCVDIYETTKGSYIILFSDGRTYEVFEPHTVFRVPITNQQLLEEYGIL